MIFVQRRLKIEGRPIFVDASQILGLEYNGSFSIIKCHRRRTTGEIHCFVVILVKHERASYRHFDVRLLGMEACVESGVATGRDYGLSLRISPRRCVSADFFQRATDISKSYVRCNRWLCTDWRCLDHTTWTRSVLLPSIRVQRRRGEVPLVGRKMQDHTRQTKTKNVKRNGDDDDDDVEEQK